MDRETTEKTSQPEQNQEKSRPLLSKFQYTMKLDKNDLDKLNQEYDQATGKTAFKNFKDLFFTLWERAKKPVQTTDAGQDKEKQLLKDNIQDINNKNQDLRLIIQQQKDEINNLNGIIQGLSKENNTAPPADFPDTPPHIDYFLEKCTRKEAERTGKPLSKQDLLLHLFWKQVKDGPGDHLPVIFSDSEIRRILNEFKTQDNASK